MAGTNGGPPLRPRHRRGGGSGFFWFLTGGLLGALGVAVAWMMDERGEPPGGAAADNPRAAQAQPQTPPKLRYDYPTILPDLEVVVPEEDMSDRPPALPPPPEPDPLPAKELPKTAVKTPAKEPGKEGAKEATKTPPKEATKTPAKDASKEPAKPVAKEAAKEHTKPATKETSKEPTKPVAKETPKDPAKTPQPEKPAETAPKAGDSETYILQVASLGTPAEAEQFKAKLAAQGIAASIQQASVDGKTRYRIRTGPFKGKEAANKARAQLASRGHQAITIKLK